MRRFLAKVLKEVNVSNFTQDDEYPFENFAPTLAQCYFIVAAGYILAKFGPLKASDVEGVNAFASFFAMPAIICVSLADADLRDLRWELLVGIVLGKAAIFAAVAAVALLAKKPADPAMAGIYAMFSVQCNDLPVGNPLMSSLYRFVRPHMMKYLFFMPSLTLIFFGPVCQVMIERNKGKRPSITNWPRENSKIVFLKTSSRMRKLLRFLRLNVAQSPVVISTFLGLFLNLIFEAKMPAVLRHPIHVLAATIPGIALCVLGFRMVGKERYLLSTGIVSALVLVFVKIFYQQINSQLKNVWVATPLILHAIVKCLSHRLLLSQELCDFALLYGIISLSAVIFKDAERSNIRTSVMGAALIISSLTCFPLSYVIAKLTIKRPKSLMHYAGSLRSVSFYVGCISTVCCVCTFAFIFWKKCWRKSPHSFVEGLVVFQVLISCSAILAAIESERDAQWMQYIHLVLSTIGEIGAVVWSSVLMLFMVIQEKLPLVLKDSPCILYTATSGLSILLTMVLVLLNAKQNSGVMEGYPTGTFDYHQLFLTSVVLACCIVVMVTCVVLYHRKVSSISAGTCVQQVCFPFGDVFSINAFPGEHALGNNKYDVSKVHKSLFEENDMNHYYQEVIHRKEKHLAFGPMWTPRMLSLLTLQSIVMSVRFCTNVHKLADFSDYSVVVPLEYLQAVLFIGQGVISFLVFGMDIRTLTFSAVKWFRSLKYQTERVQHVRQEEREVIDRWCSSFLDCYYSRCFMDLARERTWKNNHYKNSFWGHQMAEWLVWAGVASDLEEAEGCGQKLLLGGLIQHVRNEHNFHDAPYLYYFPKSSSE